MIKKREKAGEGVTAYEVAQELGVSVGEAFETLKGLEKKGIVRMRAARWEWQWPKEKRAAAAAKGRR